MNQRHVSINQITDPSSSGLKEGAKLSLVACETKQQLQNDKSFVILLLFKATMRSIRCLSVSEMDLVPTAAVSSMPFLNRNQTEDGISFADSLDVLPGSALVVEARRNQDETIPVFSSNMPLQADFFPLYANQITINQQGELTIELDDNADEMEDRALSHLEAAPIIISSYNFAASVRSTEDIDRSWLTWGFSLVDASASIIDQYISASPMLKAKVSSEAPMGYGIFGRYFK